MRLLANQNGKEKCKVKKEQIERYFHLKKHTLNSNLRCIIGRQIALYSTKTMEVCVLTAIRFGVGQANIFI